MRERSISSPQEVACFYTIKSCSAAVCRYLPLCTVQLHTHRWKYFAGKQCRQIRCQSSLYVVSLLEVTVLILYYPVNTHKKSQSASTTKQVSRVHAAHESSLSLIVLTLFPQKKGATKSHNNCTMQSE